jgi:hypothetical protein
MSTPVGSAERCFRCGAPLTERTVSLTESETNTSAVSAWVLCSWECAAEFTARMVRTGRDAS